MRAPRSTDVVVTQLLLKLSHETCSVSKAPCDCVAILIYSDIKAITHQGVSLSAQHFATRRFPFFRIGWPVMSGRGKRKRTASQAPILESGLIKKQKRNRGKQIAASPRASPHPHGQIDLDKEYRIRSILRETKTQYLIDWEDDELTGEIYAQTWEPRENANQQAVDDWERQKVKTKKTTSAVRSTTPVRPRGRIRRVIDSSPPSTQHRHARPDRNQTSIGQTTLEDPIIVESPQSVTEIEQDLCSDSGSALFVAEASQVNHPIVDIGGPSSSILAGHYQKFSSSQIPPSSSNRPTQLADQVIADGDENSNLREITTIAVVATTPLARQQSVPLNFGSARVIPDSQSLLNTFGTVARSSSLPAQRSTQASISHTDLATLSISPSTSDLHGDVLRPWNTLDNVQVNSQPILGTDTSSGVRSLDSTGRALFPLRRLGAHSRGPIVVSKFAEATPGDSTAQAVNVSQALRKAKDKHSESVKRPGLTTNLEELSTPLAAQQQGFEESGAHVPLSLYQYPNTLDTSVNVPASPLFLSERVSYVSPPENSASLDRDIVTNRQATEYQAHQKDGTPDHTSRIESQSQQRFVSLSASSSAFPFQTQIQPPSSNVRTNHSSPASVSQAEQLGSSPGLLHDQSPAISSVSIARVPSQLINLGESAPPRLTTPSSPLSSGGRDVQIRMNSPQIELTPRLRLEQQLKAIREERSRKIASMSLRGSTIPPSGQDSGPSDSAPTSKPLLPPSVRAIVSPSRRSPSAVPAISPHPVITTEEMNTSERFETLIPQASEGEDVTLPRNAPITNNSTAVLPFQNARETSSLVSTHIVPIGLLGFQKDQYREMVYYHKDMIKDFLNSYNAGAGLVADATAFVERVRHITLHPDLDNQETLTQVEVEPSQQAQWDIDCSTKCRFLKLLLGYLRERTMHVAILCPTGRIRRMLDTFLDAIKVQRRQSESQSSIAEGAHDGLTVTLISTDDISLSAADLIILMEPAITKEDIHKTNVLPSMGACTVIVLLVPSSIEHVAWSLSAGLSDQIRLRCLVSGIYQLRNEVGKLQDNQMTIDKAASAIASHLSNEGSVSEWPVPTVDILLGFDSQTDSESSLSHVGAKRSLDNEETHNNNKKARPSGLSRHVGAQVPTTIDPREIDLIHVSNSTEKSGPPHAGGIPQLWSANELRLQVLLQDAQARVEAHSEALRVLQYNHEELRVTLRGITTERDEAIATAQRAVARLADSSSKLAELQMENRGLKSQLDDANTLLQTHDVPEQAAFQRIRHKLQTAQQEREKADARTETMKRDLEYAQEMYQTASSDVQAVNAERNELASQLAAVQDRATGEQARLRQLGYDEQNRNLRNEVKKLRLLVHEREASIKSRDEEIGRLKEASRGRMGTRGVSVPRSPRLGSPLMMDRGRGTARQSSPASVEVKGRVGQHTHPLRNV
nr:hypothetical protein CFP56_29844 [Quercus suber]